MPSSQAVFIFFSILYAQEIELWSRKWPFSLFSVVYIASSSASGDFFRAVFDDCLFWHPEEVTDTSITGRASPLSQLLNFCLILLSQKGSKGLCPCVAPGASSLFLRKVPLTGGV